MDTLHSLMAGDALTGPGLIAWAFLVTNGARLVTYLPQIAAVWRCRDGARALSLLTWSSWVVGHLTAVLYGAVVLHDGFFVAVALINVAGSAAVVVIAAHRRGLWQRGRAVALKLRRAMPGLLGAICLTVLPGCGTGPLGMGTPYQPQGWSGGYDSTQLAPNVFRVTFTANAYTLPSTATDFALLRSAELALERGYTHFAVVNGSDWVQLAQVTTPVTQVQTDVFAGQVRSREVTVGQRTTTSASPGSTNTIVCFKGAPSQTAVLVMDARAIHDQLTAKHGLPRRKT